MNHRLTLAAAVAVILASISEFAIISRAGWLVTAIGAVIVVALAGTLTRLSAVPAAIGATLLGIVASVPLYAASSPYLKAAGLAIAVACAASASRLRLLPAFASLVSYLAALLLYLNALLAGGQSVVGLVPTIASLRHLVRLASNALALAKLPPPVPGTHGVQLLAAGSIGLAAIVVDVLAVRLHRPAIAGLPLLVLFMAPITTAARGGGFGGAFTFLAAAAGYLGLLSADGRDRLRGWGRVITVWHYAGEDERLGGAEVGALAATGRRIGLAAVCMAIVVPLLLPSLHLHRIFPGGSGGGIRVNDVRLPDPIVQLRGLIGKGGDQPVLSYRTSEVGAVGAAGQFQPGAQYLQVYVLNYDPGSTSWQLIKPDASTPVGSGALQSTPGSTAATPAIITRTSVRFGAVDGYSSPIFFLPVPYAPAQMRIPGSWQESDGTLMIYSGLGNRAGLRYQVTSTEPAPTPAMLEVPQQLPTAIKTSYLSFGSSVTGQLRAIAQQITRGKQNAYSKAIALEDWFLSGRFTYSLSSTLPDSPAGLLRFLTKDKQGFCQQYAFAMAVLARLVGIPSRVAIGYTAGQHRAGGSWLVSTNDAHAWPELYFANVGWLRFEPTPGGPGGQGTAVQPAYVTAAHAGGSSTGGNVGPGGHPVTPSGALGGHVRIPRIARPIPGLGARGAGPIGPPASKLPLVIGAAAILLLAGAAPGTIRLVVRRRRWQAASTDTGLARVAWQELCDDLDDLGMPCRPSESPRAVARRVCSVAEFDDEARNAVGRITTAVERARYAHTPPTVGQIRADVTLVRRSLARSVGQPANWRARLLPASTLGPIRSATRQALGLLTGWMPSARENAA